MGKKPSQFYLRRLFCCYTEGGQFFIEIIKAQLILYGHSISDVFNWMQEKGYTAYDIKKDCIISKLTVPKEGYAILFLPPAYPLPHGISIT